MRFKYLARNQEGKTQAGTIDSDSEKAAIETLQSHKLVIVAIQSIRQEPLFSRNLKVFDFVNKKDVVVFCRQLAILVGADVPLVESLRSLSRQTTKPALRNVIDQMANDIEGGSLLSKALSKHPKVFSAFYVNLIKSGEAAGRLQSSLEFLADHLEKDYYLKAKVKRAMVYPIFVISLFIIITFLMLIFVVPNLISFVQQEGAELPLITTIIIALSDFAVAYGWLLFLAAAVLIIFILYWIKTPLGRRTFDRLKLKLPIFGDVFMKTYLAHFTKNLSTLVKGGLPIIQALDVSGRVITNVVYQQIIFKARDEVSKGNSISSVLENSKEIPPVVSQMVKTGEKTGRLDYVLDNLALFYSREVENVVDNLTQLIEPILIVGLGLMVGTLMAAIIMPIYSITSSIV